MLLTIVIAAYNKEELLPRCLESLIVSADLMEKVQVLIVNDGSKDRTIDIAKAYEKKYPGYFTAIDKENGNYGSVMNHALPLAQGKYFRTLDADDWYDTKAYVQFIKELDQSDADMVISQRIDYIEDKDECTHNSRAFNAQVITCKDLDADEIDWTNLSIRSNLNVPHITYKTELIRESGLRWIEGIFYTDTMYDFWPLRLVRKVRFIPENVYVYLTGSNDQSMSPQNIERNFEHFAQVAQAILEEYKSHRVQKCSMTEVQFKFINQILGFTVGNMLTLQKRKDRLKEIYDVCQDCPEVLEFFDTIRFYGVQVFKYFKKGRFPLSYHFFRHISLIKKTIIS